jgi:hypothetical protein
MKRDQDQLREPIGPITGPRRIAKRDYALLDNDLTVGAVYAARDKADL